MQPRSEKNLVFCKQQSTSHDCSLTRGGQKVQDEKRKTVGVWETAGWKTKEINMKTKDKQHEGVFIDGGKKW